MKKSIRIASVSLVLGLTSAVAAAQQVTYDLDRTKNFAEVKTFALKPGTTESDNPLVNQRVIATIAATLSARGLRQVDRDPDVFVIPKMTVEMRKEVTAYDSGYWPWYGGYYWGGGPWYWDGGWGVGTTTFSVRELQYNTLVIDMVDANTGALIWRGKGVKRVHSHWKPHEVDRKVQKTVAKMVDKLPPTSTAMARLAP